MKYIFLTLAILISLNGRAQTTDFNYNEVVEVPNTPKNALYDRAIGWITENFVSTKAVIENQDKEEGVIYGKAILVLDESKNFKSHVDFFFRVEVKDNKFRYTFKNYVYSDWYPEYSRGPMEMTMAVPNTKRMTKKYWEKTKARVRAKAEGNVASLTEAMKKKGSDW